MATSELYSIKREYLYQRNCYVYIVTLDADFSDGHLLDLELEAKYFKGYCSRHNGHFSFVFDNKGYATSFCGYIDRNYKVYEDIKPYEERRTPKCTVNYGVADYDIGRFYEDLRLLAVRNGKKLFLGIGLIKELAEYCEQEWFSPFELVIRTSISRHYIERLVHEGTSDDDVEDSINEFVRKTGFQERFVRSWFYAARYAFGFGNAIYGFE